MNASRSPKRPRLRRFLPVLLAWTILGGGLWINPRSTIAQETRYPIAVAASESGDLFIVDLDLPGVFKQDKGGKIEVFREGSKRLRQPLNRPRCVAVLADGKILVGDSASRDVFLLESGSDPKPLTEGHVGIPMSLAVEGETVYVADLETRFILKFPLAGGRPEVFAKVNTRGLFLASDKKLWGVTQESSQLMTFDEQGTSTAIVKEPVFEFPHNVVVDTSGIAYVTDGYRKAVWRVAPDTAPEVFVSGGPLMGPVGIAMRDKMILIADPQAKKVFELNPEDRALKAVFP